VRRAFAAQRRRGAGQSTPPIRAPTDGAEELSADMLIGTGDLLQVTVYGRTLTDRCASVIRARFHCPVGSVSLLLSIRDGEQLVAKELARGGISTIRRYRFSIVTYSISHLSSGGGSKPGIYPLPAPARYLTHLRRPAAQQPRPAPRFGNPSRSAGPSEHCRCLRCDASQHSNVQVSRAIPSSFPKQACLRGGGRPPTQRIVRRIKNDRAPGHRDGPRTTHGCDYGTKVFATHPRG